MKVFSPKPLSLEFALSRNVKLGHVKKDISLSYFFPAF